MIVKRFRMVLTDQKDRLFHPAYIGDDAAKAQEVFDKEAADSKNLCVRMFVYPSPAKTRYPSTEHQQQAHLDSLTVTTAIPAKKATAPEARSHTHEETKTIHQTQHTKKK
jgi:hypothetical protein